MDLHNGTVHLDVSMLQWLVYVVLPWLVDFVSRRFANAQAKSILLTTFALVAVIAQEGLQHGGDFDVPGLIGKFVTALATAFVTHQYVWKPLKITGDNGVILKALPAGIGAVDPLKVVEADRRMRMGDPVEPPMRRDV